MMTKGAIGNLINRYKAVLAKCNLINTFGSLAVASMLVLGGAGVTEAVTFDRTLNLCQSPDRGMTFTLTSEDNEYKHVTSGRAINHQTSDHFFIKGEDGSSIYIESTDSHAIVAGPGLVELKADSVTIKAASNAVYIDGLMSIEAKNIVITSQNEKKGAILFEDGLNTSNQTNTIEIKGETASFTGFYSLYAGLGGVTNLSVGEATFNGDVVLGKDAQKGQGIFNILSGTTTINGKVYQDGGRTTVGKEAALSVSSGEFKNSIASSHGGAIYNAGTLTIANADFSNNKVDNRSSGETHGGAIYNAGGNVEISGSTFSGNTAYLTKDGTVDYSQGHGGAIYTRIAGTILKVSDSTFTGNKAGKIGGAIYVSESTADFTGNTFDSNESNCAGVMYVNTANTTFTGNTFKNNKSLTGEGGAIVLQAGKETAITSEFTDNTFTDNIAATDGGALKILAYGAGVTATLKGNNTFTGNTATDKGGAIYNAGTLIIDGNATFSGNSAAEGDDIYNAGTLIINGTAALDGGIAGTGTMDGTGTVLFSKEETSVEQASIGETLTAQVSGELNDKLGGDVSKYTDMGFSKVKMGEGDIFGEVIADGDKVVRKNNTLMDAALKLASVNTVALAKILTNDVRKRLGDIRSDKNTTGVWMRWDGGKLSGNGLSNDFNTIQIGGDTKVGKNCRLGVAGSFTHGDSEFARGVSELEGFSFATYATWMGENGMFADVVARLGQFSNEMKVEGRTGDMDNRVFSLSGEYGWRLPVFNQFFVEPQVELAYTYVSSDELELGTAKYAFDNVDSLTGRAGVVFGWNLPDDRGNVYARASVLQQFMGDAKISGSNGSARNVQKIDGDDTWLEYGIGANVKLTDKTYIWADVERTEGAKIEEEWRGTVGIRYSF